MEVSDGFFWAKKELQLLNDEGLIRDVKQARVLCAGRIFYQGKKLFNFSSNDYLGLSQDIRLKVASCNAAKAFGAGSGSSPLIAGRFPLVEKLELALAKWEGADGVIVFPSGYAANLGILSGLIGPRDTVLGDALNHASLIDGCRLSKAAFRFYRHNDLNHLESLIRQLRSKSRRIWIVTDSLFSMDGDIANLKDIFELGCRYSAMVVVDEAHATGVFGKQGTGFLGDVVQGNGWPPFLIKTGTLSKAFGCQGGFVCANKDLIQLARNKCRSYFFSTGISPTAVGASLAALKIIKEGKERNHLLEVIQYFHQKLQNSGLASISMGTQIIPLLLGSPARAIDWASQLEIGGFLVPPIRPPSVPIGKSRIRISLSVYHSKKTLIRLIESLVALQNNGTG